MINKDKLDELKKESNLMQPIVRIGKNGLNENALKEIQVLLKKRRHIKIKALSNSLQNNSIDDMISKIVDECKCTLVNKIGLTFTIYK